MRVAPTRGARTPQCEKVLVIRHISLTMREQPSNSAPLLRLVHAARSELIDPHLSRALVLVDGAMPRRRCSLRASPRGSPWTAASCRWI